MKPVALLLLLGIGIAALWDAVYRVGPDENVFITRFGENERFEPAPGLQVKMPFVEQAESVPKSASFSAEGEGVFLTMDKQRLPLRYAFHWEITDDAVFVRASGGQTYLTSRRVEQIAHDLLRSQVVKLSRDDLGLLRQAGRVTYRSEEGAGTLPAFDRLIADVNTKAAQLGVAVNGWEIETHADIQ